MVICSTYENILEGEMCFDRECVGGSIGFGLIMFWSCQYNIWKTKIPCAFFGRIALCFFAQRDQNITRWNQAIGFFAIKTNSKRFQNSLIFIIHKMEKHTALLSWWWILMPCSTHKIVTIFYLLVTHSTYSLLC
jgi:hypothetical protein